MKILEIIFWTLFFLYCLQIIAVVWLAILQQFADVVIIKSKKILILYLIPFWFVYSAWKKLPNE